MTAELVEKALNHRIRRGYRNGEPDDTLPRTGYDGWPSGTSEWNVSTNVRLPWIHNKELFEFHS